MCKWTEDEDGVYQTECGHSFFFDTDGASENGCKFCCYCGAELVDVKFVEAVAGLVPPGGEEEKGEES